VSHQFWDLGKKKAITGIQNVRGTWPYDQLTGTGMGTLLGRGFVKLNGFTSAKS
jgi:hypothetical protein